MNGEREEGVVECHVVNDEKVKYGYREPSRWRKMGGEVNTDIEEREVYQTPSLGLEGWDPLTNLLSFFIFKSRGVTVTPGKKGSGSP